MAPTRSGPGCARTEPGHARPTSTSSSTRAGHVPRPPSPGAPDAPAIQYFDGASPPPSSTRSATRSPPALVGRRLPPGRPPGRLPAERAAVRPRPCWPRGRRAASAVSINPMNQARELEYLLNDSGASVLLCLESALRATSPRDVVAEAPRSRSVITTQRARLPDPPRPDGCSPSQRARRPRGHRATWPS